MSKAKIVPASLFVLALAALAVALGSSLRKNGAPPIAYHQSVWNEFAPEIERAIAAESAIKPVNLAHVYGGVVSHHIPTTIPKLVEFYRRLKQTQSVKNFIVIGPDHTDAGKAPVTSSNASFITAYGELKPIEGLAQQLYEVRVANVEEAPFTLEHSIGSQVLIIGRLFPGSRVTPVILRSDTTEDQARALGRKIGSLLDDGTVLVASVDFSHYLSTEQAEPIDRISGEVVSMLDLDSLALIKADSNKSMAVFMEAMKAKNAGSTDALTIMNTNDLIQDSDYTTGYVFGFWGTGRDIPI